MDKIQKEKYSNLRKALNEKFDSEGAAAMTDQELLCLILSVSEPAFSDIIADKMINTFGSLQNVFFTAPERLMSSCGISLSSAALIKLIPTLSYTGKFDAKAPFSLRTSYLAKLFFEKLLSDTVHEQFAAAAVDSDFKKHANIYMADSASISRISCSSSEIASYTLGCGSDTIFIAHSHPEGDSAPSDADAVSTAELVKSLGKLGVKVADHIIIGRNSAFSMRFQGFEEMFPPIAGYNG